MVGNTMRSQDTFLVMRSSDARTPYRSGYNRRDAARYGSRVVPRSHVGQPSPEHNHNNSDVHPMKTDMPLPACVPKAAITSADGIVRALIRRALI